MEASALTLRNGAIVAKEGLQGNGGRGGEGHTLRLCRQKDVKEGNHGKPNERKRHEQVAEKSRQGEVCPSTTVTATVTGEIK